MRIKKQALRTIGKVPLAVQRLFADLVEDLKYMGPIRADWPNFSKLSGNSYHCHLNYSWVACWTWEKNSVIVEVYYAGSRENAPY